ncbi:MAG TPA: alpha/beta fold hydrolase [Jatrophihabitans sp.]|nr:alpha/beta fold hydrolase [Jatrophihabitans sp.]
MTGVDLDRIVPLQPEGSAPPLFCVHASSGSAYSYVALAQALGPDQPVYGIEAPGFDNDREPVRSLPALADEYAATVRAMHPDGPVRLLGWSMGGVIAFEMARRLVAASTPVERVIMVDVSAPWIAELPPEKEIAARFLHDLLATVGAAEGGLGGIVEGLPDTAGSAEVFVAAEASEVLPEELDADLLAERYAVFRAHIEALWGFAVAEPYPGPVTHLVASASPAQYMRWDDVAPDLTEHPVPGDHHSIWWGESLAVLTGLVRKALAG